MKKFIFITLFFSSGFLFLNPMLGYTQEKVNPDNDSSFKAFLPKWEQCISGFINGNPSLWKQNNSQSDSATFFGAFGGHEKGWNEINARLSWASSKFKESGAKVNVEYISIIVSGNLAYTVSIERGEERFGNMKQAAPRALRSTQIYRKENGVWKLLHRHADPLFEKKVTATTK